MQEKKVSSRYAKAIYGLAKENNVEEKVLTDFHLILKTIIDSRELSNLIESPIISSDKKTSILNEIFGDSLSQLTLSFLKLLSEKSRENLIDDIANEYELVYNKENNRLPVTILSSVELDEPSKIEIQNKLAAWTNKTILPEYKVDSEIKGGLKIKIDDWVFDASIQNQLNKLRTALAG